MKCSNCNNIYFICKILEFSYVFVICKEKNVTITKGKLLNYLGKCFVHNKGIPGSKYLIYMYNILIVIVCVLDYVKNLYR